MPAAALPLSHALTLSPNWPENSWRPKKTVGSSFLLPIEGSTAGETISLKDIQAARAAHRRALRGQINERIARITDFLPGPAPDQAPQLPSPVPRRATPRLRTYLEDTR